MQYINYNGNFYGEDTPLFTANNRALKYGDGFFESMVMLQGQMPLLTKHAERIRKSIEALKMDVPFEISEALLKQVIDELVTKNSLGNNIRVRLQFFREGEGLYLTYHNKASYILTAQEFSNTKFELNEIEKVDVCPVVRKQFDLLSGIKTNSALLYVTAAQWAANNNLADALILNTNGEICEAASSNIIIVKGDVLLTPPISSGCIAGVMRDYLVSRLNITEAPITETDLISAEEIWLTNAVKGIQSVKSYKAYTYKNKKAMETIAFLNNIFGL